MNDELYEYINKKKQSVVKQYDLLLERIQLSKNPKSAIALMCDEEFIVREPQYPISELLDLMSVFIDEYYKDNELFQDCTKEITDEYITYATEDQIIIKNKKRKILVADRIKRSDSFYKEKAEINELLRDLR